MANANFETGPFGTSGTVTGWTVGGSHHVANNAEGATSGTHAAALSAGGDSQGDTLSQNFSTLTGHVYALDFDAAISGKRTGNPLQLQVQVTGSGTLLNQTLTPPDAGTFNPGSVVFQHFHFTFTANSTTTAVEFSSVGLGNASADQVVDTVVIRPVNQSSPTPTPTPTPTPGPTPTVRISTNATTIPEGGNAIITVSASSAPVQPLTVAYTVTGKGTLGTDFTLSGIPGQVVIPAGQTSVMITLHALLDTVTEKNESAKIKLSKGVDYKLPKGSGGKSVTIKITNVP